MTTRLAPRGHETFDVYDGATFVGSVWHYHDGWVPMSRRWTWLVSGGFYPTAEMAAAVLTGSPGEVES